MYEINVWNRENMKNTSDKIHLAKAGLILSALVFGTIGIFRKSIDLSSGTLACARGITGALFIVLTILLISLFGKHKINLSALKKNLLWLVLSGIAIGVNWVLLFESYSYTSVAVSTLCYYTAPMMLIAVSPFLFKEKFTPKKLVCVLMTVVGTVLVSGVCELESFSFGEIKGVLFGIAAAVLYATVIVVNMKIKGVGAYEKTAVQLFCAGVFMIPYVLFVEKISLLQIAEGLDAVTLILLLTVCFVHTGLAYVLYFSSIGKLSAQTIALFSYIDPVFAIVLSFVILKEKLSFTEIIGGVLILAAMAVNELVKDGNNRK